MIPAFRKLRQERCYEFQTRMGYGVFSCLNNRQTGGQMDSWCPDLVRICRHAKGSVPSTRKSGRLYEGGLWANRVCGGPEQAPRPGSHTTQATAPQFLLRNSFSRWPWPGWLLWQWMFILGGRTEVEAHAGWPPTCSVAQDDLECLIFLPPPPQCSLC